MNADICVIVPTIREFGCMRDYFENARNHGFDLSRLHVVLVTEDFCPVEEMETMLDEEGVSGEIFDGEGRKRWFRDRGISDYRHVVPSASHAETSFGLLYMWYRGFPYGVFIDDDTSPDREDDFFGTHLRNLEFTGPIEAISSDRRWVNVLHRNAAEHGLYPRGYPYSAMNETVSTATSVVSDVVASQGLWTNVPDLDAIRILMDGDLEGRSITRTTRSDVAHDFVVAPGDYLTVCSMNLAFKREIIPAFYQLPMDDNRWNVGRFDDIWSGVILKRACDLLGKHIYNGTPLCRHDKAARSTFDDLHNEVAGLELNEHLWEIVDGVTPADEATNRTFDGTATGYAAVFEAIARRLHDGQWSEYHNGAFFNHMGACMLDWLDCLAALDRVPVEAAAD